MFKVISILIISLFYTVSAFAWQGYNVDNGTIIIVNIEEGQENIQMGNVTYFDYDSGQEKIGYLNMYENNLGLLMDLDSGDLIRVQMERRN